MIGRQVLSGCSHCVPSTSYFYSYSNTCLLYYLSGVVCVTKKVKIVICSFQKVKYQETEAGADILRTIRNSRTKLPSLTNYKSMTSLEKCKCEYMYHAFIYMLLSVIESFWVRSAYVPMFLKEAHVSKNKTEELLSTTTIPTYIKWLIYSKSDCSSLQARSVRE